MSLGVYLVFMNENFYFNKSTHSHNYPKSKINILPFGSNKEKNSDVLSHSNFSPYAPQGQYVYFPAK